MLDDDFDILKNLLSNYSVKEVLEAMYSITKNQANEMSDNQISDSAKELSMQVYLLAELLKRL